MARVLIADAYLTGLFGTVNARPVWGVPARSLFLYRMLYGRVAVRDAAGNVRTRWRYVLGAAPAGGGVAYDEADWSPLAAAVPVGEGEP